MRKELKELRDLIEQELEKTCDNVKRRALHAKVELLRLDMEEDALRNKGKLVHTPIKMVEKQPKSGGGTVDVVIAASTTKVIAPTISEEEERVLTGLVTMLHLAPIKRSFKWWYWLDVVFRFIGVCMGFLTVGVLLSLPVILLRVVDYLFGISPFNSLSEWLKRAICRFILILSGVEVHIEGLHRDSFKQSCALLTFSHASNIDGFLVSLTCPIRHYAFAKKELFYVPFFSWISIAIGGVPVDRDNRDRAVATLKRISDAAKDSNMCLVIAPEGTRSLTGQLLPFKKGVSHMWEELKAPIVPVVLYGAWDLYPVGSWVNQCGYVAVRYLKPILPTEIKSREDMLRLLRRRMLESSLDCPSIIGTELSWLQRVRCVVVTLLNILFDYACAHLFRDICFRQLGLSTLAAGLYSLAGVVFVTIALYLWAVYSGDFYPKPKKD